MTDLMLQLEQVLHHSQRYYLQLCAWCDQRGAGSGGSCDHTRELLGQARARSRTLGRHPRTLWDPAKGPWFPAIRGEVGLAWPEGSQLLDLSERASPAA